MSSLTLEPASIDQARAEGFEDLLVAHWEEAETDPSPMAPNWTGYYGLERAGVLKMLLLRRGGQLIGYSVWFVQKPLHHALTTWAVCDLIYVEPEERKGWTGAFLVRQSERLLRGFGVQVINYNVKPRSSPDNLDYKRGRDSVGHLLRRLGYALYEEVWTRHL